MLACVMLLGCALPASDRTGFQAAPTVASTQARNPASDLAGFEEWKLAHGKTYGSPAEEASRYRAWTASCEELAHLEVLNFAAGVGDDAESVKMGLNVFADVNPSTFVADRCGLRPGTVKVQARHGSVRSVHHPPALRWASLPAKVDWRPEGLVTPPKDQGQCGSCWAFSAVAAIEGQHARKSKKLLSLSEQNLVDCVHNETINPLPPNSTMAAAPRADEEKCCMGCSGGLMDVAYEYMLDRQHGGINTEADYAYRGRASRSCEFTPKAVGAVITGWVDVPVGDEVALMHAVATVGPISIGVDARAWQFYFGGVFPAWLCSTSPSEMDHGVAIVGYGTTAAGTDYWIIKNSWSAAWGEGGYLRLHRGSNACGISNAASYPLV